MKITIALTLCHMLPNIPAAPVCREEVIAQTDIMASCLIGQPAIADWKAHSIYRSDAWSIARVKCVMGSYESKDAI